MVTTAAKRPARKRTAVAATPDVSDDTSSTTRRAPRKRTATGSPTQAAKGTKGATPATAPASKRPAARKAATAPAAAPARRGRKPAAAVDDKPARVVGEVNDFGMRPGTDSMCVMDALMSGATNRSEINEMVTEAIEKSSGLQTRGGVDKNIPSLVSGMIRRLRADGWDVESTFRMIPPKHLKDAVDARVEELARERASAARRAKREARKAAK